MRGENCMPGAYVAKPAERIAGRSEADASAAANRGNRPKGSGRVVRYSAGGAKNSTVSRATIFQCLPCFSTWQCMVFRRRVTFAESPREVRCSNQSRSTDRRRVSPSFRTTSMADCTQSTSTSARTSVRSVEKPGIAESNAARNEEASPEASALARPENRSETSRAGSAAASGAASKQASITRRVMLRAITGVDPDIAFGKVARPESRFALALAPNGQADFALRFVQLRLEFRF